VGGTCAPGRNGSGSWAQALPLPGALIEAQWGSRRLVRPIVVS